MSERFFSELGWWLFIAALLVAMMQSFRAAEWKDRFDSIGRGIFERVAKEYISRLEASELVKCVPPDWLHGHFVAALLVALFKERNP